MWQSNRGNSPGSTGSPAWFGVGAAAIVLLGVTSAPIHGQRLPFEEGSPVRYSLTGDTATDALTYGEVLSGTRTELLVRLPDGGGPTLVRFQPGMTLQVHDGKQSRVILGTALGVVAGAALGATALSTSFGENRLTEDQQRLQSGIVFGAGGGVVGGLVSTRFGADNWVPVDLRDGVIHPAPRLTDNAGDYSVRRRQNRWDRFDATERDFRSFFAAYAEDLGPIEGIWELEATSRRVAIVRDQGFDGYAYVMVNITHPLAPAFRDGTVALALRATSDPVDYEVAIPGRDAVGHRAELIEDVLIVRPRGGSRLVYNRRPVAN